jgi:hypothetical protein
MAGRKHLPVHLPTTDTGLAYLAGIIDGEGCICVCRIKNPKARNYSHTIVVTISNTNEALMLWIGKIWGRPLRYEPGRSSNRKPQWRADATGQAAVKIIEAILPYMIAKKPQAELALQLANVKKFTIGEGLSHNWLHPSVVAEREEITTAIHALNKRGVA